jgi:peptidoglycan/xylan/chitin deacetylase (PgdA/CDA1 family)
MRSALKSIRRKLISVASQRPVVWGTRGAVVSFTFDDFPRTALTVGGEILKALGARGTYYTAMGMMGTVNHLGDQFRREDLDVLLHDGHELASHTFSHVSSQKVSTAQYREEVRKGQRAIQELTGQESSNFAYPYGRVTLGAKRKAGEDVSSARGIWGGVNGPVVDLNLLRANSLYGSRADSSQAEELILENERQNGWLIFYSHDVQPEPSPYGCTPGLLELAVSFAAKRGTRILTVAEVITELTASRLEISSDSHASA